MKICRHARSALSAAPLGVFPARGERRSFRFTSLPLPAAGNGVDHFLAHDVGVARPLAPCGESDLHQPDGERREHAHHGPAVVLLEAHRSAVTAPGLLQHVELPDGDFGVCERPVHHAALAGEIDDAIRELVRIPPARLAVGDRIRVLLEEYQNATERVESVESELERRDQRIDELEKALAEARNQGGVLSS